ncbi:N-acetyltransferase [Aquisalimonas sp. APHAB1-3]|uniref:N-acetyltransferase n=1 Tax=Aquisalimonas sp. APHAB1-3 TaxID=3402080 RepID=UPI003AAEFA8B
MKQNPTQKRAHREGEQTRLDRALFFVSRVLRRLTRGRVQLYRYYLVAQPVPEDAMLPPGRGRTIEVRRIREGDPVLERFPRPAKVLAARFAQGALCYTAFRSDEVSGFLWFTPGDYEEDEVRCLFRPQPSGACAWDFDVYVAARDRIGPTFARLWDTAYADMRARGIAWTLSRISAFNQGSLASHSRLGARFLESLTFVVAGPAQVMFRGRFPFVYMSVTTARRPVVSVAVPPKPVMKVDSNGEVVSDA